MKYKPYPAYKDSGVEWLGEIPEGWELKRLKWSTTAVKNGVWGDEPQGDENDIVCIRVADFDRNNQSVDDTNLTIRNIKSSDLEGRLLAEGDLLIEKSGGGENWPVGFVVRFNHVFPAVTSNFMARISLSGCANGNYFKYFHLSLYSGRVTTRSINQTSGIQNLDATSYFNNLAVFPPIQTQRAIASFLDTETARIDGLIKDYEELIELLKEKRQALISHAVTRGLSELVSPDDPEFGEWAKPVTFKDSGVEWIGEIPEGWEVQKLKHISVSWCDGPFGSGLKSEHYSDDGARVIRLQNLGTLKFEENDAAYIPLTYASGLGDHFVEPADLLVAGLGDDNNPVGRAVVAPDNIGIALVKADCFRFRLNSESTTRFFAFQLSATAIPYSKQFSTGTTRERVNLSTMANRPVVLPSSVEQKVIADFLVKEIVNIDSLFNESESAIELLKEHRSALITNAVTGKINVEARAR